MTYRCDHSTLYILTPYIQSFIDWFYCKPPKSIIGIFINISAAFEKVWRQKLLLKLYDLEISRRAIDQLVFI